MRHTKQVDTFAALNALEKAMSVIFASKDWKF